MADVGRPTKLVPETVTKLESVFKVGGSKEEACSYAGISTRSYDRYMADDEDFVLKMTAAQHYADIVAKNVVVDKIINDRDLQTAKWWLEQRQFRKDTSVGMRSDGESIEVVIKSI